MVVMSACSSGSDSSNKRVRGIHVNVLKFDPTTWDFGNSDSPATLLIESKGRPEEEISWEEFVGRQRLIKEDDHGSHRRDRGWFIVFCSFVINLLTLGFLKSLGILIIEFKNDFETTAADVAVIVSVTYCLNSIAGPLACYMAVKYTPRCVALTGALMVAFGLMLSWFATSVLHMCFTVGVLVGIGSGLTYSPGLILVGLYFDKYRAIANGIVVSGSPVGGMLMPYIINYIAESLNSRDTLLIVGGILLNSCICALAFQNPEEKLKSTSVSIGETEKDTSKLVGARGAKKEFQVVAVESLSNLRLANSRAGDKSLENINQKETLHRKRGRKKKARKKSSAPVCTMFSEKYLGSKPVHGEKSWFIPTQCTTKKYSPNQQKTEVEDSKLISNSTQSSVIRNRSKVKNVSTISSYDTSSDSKTQRQSSQEAHQYILALDHSCMVLLPQEHMRQCGSKYLNTTSSDNKATGRTFSTSSGTHETTNNTNDKEPSQDVGDSNNKDNVKDDTKVKTRSKKKHSPCCSSFCKDNKYFSVSSMKWLLRDPMYMILLIANATPAMATTNVVLLAPSFAEYLGMKRDDFSSICLAISLSDLTGRLLGTFLSDKGVMRPKTVYSSGLFVAGAASLFLGVGHDFYSVVVICSFFGIGTGFHIGIMGVLLQEIVGIELLPAGYALSMILNGVIVLIGPYFCGYLLSAYPGCYMPMFFVFGLFLMGGASLFLIPSCRKKLKKLTRKKDKAKDNVTDNENGLCGSDEQQACGLSQHKSQIVVDQENS